MKNLYPRLSQIALTDWLEYHPYKKEVSSDHFYIVLSNDIQHEVLHIDVDDHLVGADYKYLACVLTCYFEDIVSQTGIWTSFIDAHRSHYGKYLPFYDLAGYERGDVNLADIQFLIWHFCSHLSIHNHFVDPFSIGNAEIAETVYAMLNEAVGQAPRNEDLNAALTLPPNAHFDAIRQHLDFFFFGCYLQHYYMNTLLEGEILDVKNRNGSQKNFDQLVDSRRARLLFNRASPLLAQRSNEILAQWAGKSHPLYEKLRSLSKRKEGVFLYQGATATHLLMKHVASEIVVEIAKPDWDFPLVKDETTVCMGIVQWGDHWHVAGAVFPATSIKYLEIADREKYLFAPLESHMGVVRREEECFLELNSHQQIRFLKSKHEAFELIDAVWEAYHLKYGMDSMDRKLFDVHEVTFGMDDDVESMVVFFNLRSGMEFYPDIAPCISMANNPYFDKDAETNIEDLIIDERISSDFVLFLIENQTIEIELTTGHGGFHYVWANCDFLLRYWKKERYVSEPKLTVE